MRIKDRLAGERGGVMIVVAIVLPLLLLLTAGGVSAFSLYASNRELQRSADQAALAGAASIPLTDPNVLVENSPVPLPNTDPVYELAEGQGVNLPRMSDFVFDPRSVACAVGSDSLTNGADLVGAFSESITDALFDDDGNEITSVCDDARVYPQLQPNPDTTTVLECTNLLIQEVAADAGSLNPDLLTWLLSPIQNLVNGVAKMPLHHVLPAIYTPRMKVTSFSKLRPPLVSLVTGSETGTMRASATAYRRIKNAVVVPIIPSVTQQLQIDLGLLDGSTLFRNLINSPVNFNNALHRAQKPLIDVITNVDNRLNGIMSTFGLPCRNVLSNLRQDLLDIYNPPSGPAPSAVDIVDAAVEAAELTAAQIGASPPNPTDPNSLAGEAFLVIGVTATNSLLPISATQIPILDAAVVTIREVAEGDYRAAIVSASKAHGAFRATLIK